MARTASDITSTLPGPAVPRAAACDPKFNAIMVLCGPAPRSSALAHVGRPPGLLPLDAQGQSNVQRILRSASPFLLRDQGEHNVRVLVEANADTAAWPTLGPGARYVPDRAAFRGTAGILRDACEDLNDDDRVLVLSAGEVLDTDLASIIARVGQIESDVVLCRDAKHRPVAIWSIRVRCLRHVSEIGYCDLKEQVLTALADRCQVRVLTLPDEATGFYWLRDLSGYLDAVRAISGAEGPVDVRESDVVVADDALVVESVLLSGARVETGAIVARSVIGTRVAIRSGRRVIDQVVAGET